MLGEVGGGGGLHYQGIGIKDFSVWDAVIIDDRPSGVLPGS